MEYKYSYKLTQKAEGDLDEIVSYIAVQLANESAASNFVDNLIECIDKTCLFPESGSIVVNEFLPDIGVRKKIVGNYIIFYLLNSDDKTIMILRIVYGRRNMDEILKFMEI